MDDYEPVSQLWRVEEHNSGEVARYRQGSFTAFVQDCDGDFAWYRVSRGDEVLASGNIADVGAAYRAAEDCLVVYGKLYRPN